MNFYSSDKNTYSVSDITLKCKEASAKYSCSIQVKKFLNLIFAHEVILKN